MSILEYPDLKVLCGLVFSWAVPEINWKAISLIEFISDYAYKSAVDGRMKEAEKLRRQCTKVGEPVIFGIEEGTIEEFFRKRGFGQVKNMTPESLEDTYFKGMNRKSCPFVAIVHATVKPRE